MAGEVAAADFADRGDPDRARRAGEGLIAVQQLLSESASARQLMSTLTSKDGQFTSLPQLRWLVSKITAGVAQSLGRRDIDGGSTRTPQPDSSDPGAVAQFFDDPRYVRPRRMMEYADEPLFASPGAGFAPLAEGRLTKLSPRGLYTAHLHYCELCRKAEAEGTFCADCPSKIHVWAALLEGFWLPWASGHPPVEGSPEAKSLFKDTGIHVRYPEGDPLHQPAIDEFAKLERLGVLVRLSDEQRHNPAFCKSVCQASIVEKARMALPGDVVAHVRSGGGTYDVAVLAKAAQRDGEADAAAFESAAESSRKANTTIDYEALHRASVRHRLDGAPKYRVVTGFDRTLNPLMVETSLRYSSIGDLAAGGDPLKPRTFFVNDGSAAYYQVQPSAEAQPYLVVQHPAVPSRYFQMRGGPMGWSPMCAMFAGVMAVFRRVLGSSPPARRGEVVVTGLLDDTGQAVDDRALAEQVGWTRSVCSTIVYHTNDKEQQGKVVEYLGAVVQADTSTACMRPKKIYQLLHNLFFLRRLGIIGGERGRRTFVGRKFFESFVGDVGWLCEFDFTSRIHRYGLIAALGIAERGPFPGAPPYDAVPIINDPAHCPAWADLHYLALRVLSGRLRPMRFFPTADAALHLTSLTATTREAMVPLPFAQALALAAGGPSDSDAAAGVDRLLQAVAATTVAPTGRAVQGLAADASFEPATGRRVWAVTDGNEVLWHDASGTALSSSDLELSCVAPFMERHGADMSKKIVFFGTDSLVTMFRVNKGRADYGTYAHGELQHIYELADLHQIDLVAHWLPRAANQYLDRLSKCRSPDQAARVAHDLGLRLVARA